MITHIFSFFNFTVQIHGFYTFTLISNNNSNTGMIVFCSYSQLWATKKNLGKRFKDIPFPSRELQNALEEIPFKDKLTRSRCRGWLSLPYRRCMRADILFPGCDFDCRLTITGYYGMLLSSKVECSMSYLMKSTLFTGNLRYATSMCKIKTSLYSSL